MSNLRMFFMPKQIKDKNKSTRMKYALDAIEHNGRCSHKEISEYVARKIDANPTLSSFKKAIHNDIKDLIKDHHIGIEYFTPAGDPIPLGEEDNYKNKRTQYFLIGGEGQIKGGKLLKRFNSMFVPQQISSPSWEILKLTSTGSITSGKIGIILTILGHSYIIQTNKDELPCRIAVARHNNYLPSQEVLGGQFGKRTSLLLLPWKFLSSSKEDQLCHFIINLTLKDNQVYATIEFLQGRHQTEEDYIRKMNNIKMISTTHALMAESIEACFEDSQSGTLPLSKMTNFNYETDKTLVHNFTKGSDASGENPLPFVIRFDKHFQLLIADFQMLHFIHRKQSA